MTEQKTLLDVLRIWIRWRWLIVGVTVAAAVISSIVSLMMPPYYKSTAVFYPYNLATQDRAILFSTEASDRVLNYFGDKYDVNRLLTITQAMPLINEVIKTYDLADHYGIDTTSERWSHKVQREFSDNYKSIKTELDNVSVTVWDQDPGLAAEMANFIMRRAGEQYGGLIRERNANLFERIVEQLAIKEPQLNTLTDSLAAFRDTTSIYFKTLATQQRSTLKDVMQMRTIRDQLSVTSKDEFASIFVIEQAQTAMKKSKPTRWVIVTATTFGALFFSLLASLFIEKYRDVRKALSAQPS